MSNNNWKQMRRLMWVQTILLALILLCGCANEPLTEAELEEKLWKEGIDLENWTLCEMAYRQNNMWTLHKDHTDRDHFKHFWIRNDLVTNNCKMILREYWIEY